MATVSVSGSSQHRHRPRTNSSASRGAARQGRDQKRPHHPRRHDVPRRHSKAAELAIPLLPSGLDQLIVNGAHFGNAAFFLGPTDFSSAAQSQALHDDMHQSLDTNVLGTVYSINAFLPLVLKGTAKKIVAITTGWADPDISRPADDGAEGLPFAMGYSAMKAALNMVIAKYAAELQSQGVITLALSPGVVNTSNNQPTPEDMGPMMKMFGVFKRYYPSFEGPATPLASVEDQKNVIDGLTIANTGKFLSHHGNKEWL
ncbi:hypothetical protein LTR75_016940 [Friedmanniomyces endolithicus]|nr:hypothetical protein LTR75_016940 [Friedmanniomyces endolithicus]